MTMTFERFCARTGPSAAATGIALMPYQLAHQPLLNQMLIQRRQFFPGRPAHPQQLFDTFKGFLQTRRIIRFENIINGLGLKRVHRVLMISCRKDNKRRRGPVRKPAGHLKPAHAWHFNIQKNDLNPGRCP